MLLSEWLDDWLALRSPKLKPRTIENYKHLIERHICPALGDVALDSLSALQIQHALAQISRSGHSRTSEMCFVLLRSALRRVNPALMLDVERPAHRQASPPAWSDSEIMAYICALRGHRQQLPLLLGLLLGLRRGEICGLRWQDIDFQAGIIHIVNQRQRLATGQIVDMSPKSASSVRDLPIPQQLLPLLRSKRQLSGYICQISPSGLDAAHRRLVVRLGLKYTPLHGLRHSMATACIRHKGSMRNLQSLLGHASYTTTANRYTHPDIEMLRETLEQSSALCYTVIQ